MLKTMTATTRPEELFVNRLVGYRCFLINGYFAFLCSGRLFDKDGNLNNWWSSRSNDGFGIRENCLSKQYSKFEVYGKKVKMTCRVLFKRFNGRPYRNLGKLYNQAHAKVIDI